MAVPRIHLLSKSEKERIHGMSLDMLAETGIQFGCERALKILESAGCEVNWGDLSARIPKSVVDKALTTLPSNVLLAARNPAKDIRVDEGVLYFTSAGQSPWFRDIDSRARREATSDDLVQCTVLIDALDEIMEYTPMVLPQDVPSEIRVLKSLEIALLYTSKHFLAGSIKGDTLPFVKEMITAVLGDLSQLVERPIFSIVHEPVSPLKNVGEMVDLTLDWAPYKIPISLGGMPLAGATAPVTLAGAVLQTNVELLGNMVLFQIAQPGWPIIWGGSVGSLDMRTGRISVGPEAALMSIAMIEMAAYYNVPCGSVDVCAADAKDLSFQCGLETTFLGLTTALAGANNLWGPADMDGYTMVDLAHVMLSVDLVRQINRLLKGITIDDEHFLIDAITELGFSGEYLGHPSTKKHFKNEHLLPDIFPRESYESWFSRGQTEDQMAIHRVKEILNSHEPEPLPDDVIRELGKIMNDAEKALVN